MNQPLRTSINDLPKPILPDWVFDAPLPETLEEAGFLSGSVLALLYTTLNDPTLNVPSDLLRNRSALRAAKNCCKIEGRSVTEADLRDAFLLAAPGDARGPDGDMLALWRAGSSVNLRGVEWQGRLGSLLPEGMQDHVWEALEGIVGEAGSPISKATRVLSRILASHPRQEAVALLCVDAVLSHALGWDHPLPLYGQHLKQSDLRRAAEGEDIRITVHGAIARSAQESIRLCHDLARRTHRLKSVATKLRAKGSDAAVGLFLSEDAVLPSTMLSPVIKGTHVEMSSHAAWRFCNRLVELDVARELTGRSTFRLYGVA